MKRFMLPVLAALLLIGCASARQSEFLDHGSVYASWPHLKFSTISYQNPDQNDWTLSRQEKWWGIPVSDRPRPKVKVSE